MEFCMCAPGRVRTFVDIKSTDLQSVAIDHSATDAGQGLWMGVAAERSEAEQDP